MALKELFPAKHRSHWYFSNEVRNSYEITLRMLNEDYLGDIDLCTLLTTQVENLHAVSHFKNETFTALQYAQVFGSLIIQCPNSQNFLMLMLKWLKINCLMLYN